MVPCLQSLAKAMIQQGKFYREGTDYARELVSIGQSFLERAEEEAILVPKMKLVSHLLVGAESQGRIVERIGRIERDGKTSARQSKASGATAARLG